MSHFERELSDGDWSGVALDPNVLRNIDEKTFKAINGDDGGVWFPSSPIVIGGAGLVLLGTAAMFGAGSQVVTTAGKHIEHGRLDAADYIALTEGHDGRTRVLCTPCVGFAPELHALVSVAHGLVPTAAAQPRIPGQRFMCPLRVHHGATLASVTLTWAVVVSRAAVPVRRPRFRVVRVDKTGRVEPLRFASNTDTEGFVTLGSDASAIAYNAGNVPQDALYEVTEAERAIVDVSRYVYLAEIVEEAETEPFGPDEGNAYFYLRAENINVEHIGPE